MSVSSVRGKQVSPGIRRVREDRIAEILWDFKDRQQAASQKARVTVAGHSDMQAVIDYLHEECSVAGIEIPNTLQLELQSIMRGRTTKNKLGMIQLIAERLGGLMPTWREKALQHFGFEALI